MDYFQEIWASIRQNKLRSILTGSAIAWGIFILIILLAASTGLRNGVMSNFGNQSRNSIELWGNRTSLPYQGMQTGRRIKFTEKEAKLVQSLPEVDLFSAVVKRYGVSVSYKNNVSSGELLGVGGQYNDIQNVELVEGRFLHAADEYNRSKVVVVNQKLSTELGKGKSLVGNSLIIGGVSYTIVGVAKNENDWSGSMLYIPFSVMQIIYVPDKTFTNMLMTLQGVNSVLEGEILEKKIRTLLGNLLLFDQKDMSAIRFWNRQEMYSETMTAITAIQLFVMIVGILTLVSGIVGVSNIMLVLVKERTREIGIRKAIGAQPYTIVMSVVSESLFLTIVFGYVGMLFGIGVVELGGIFLEGIQQEYTIFKDPTVELSYVITATVILVIAGGIAGYIPAHRAAKIKPIEAMSREK